MHMPKVVVACGSGVATSQVVADKVRKMLAARGVDADVVAVEVADLPKALEDADAYVSVVKSEGEDYDVPVFNGVAFLTGMNVESELSRLILALGK
jgi:PTS system galactitol-specific IIB component